MNAPLHWGSCHRPSLAQGPVALDFTTPNSDVRILAPRREMVLDTAPREHGHKANLVGRGTLPALLPGCPLQFRHEVARDLACLL